MSYRDALMLKKVKPYFPLQTGSALYYYEYEEAPKSKYNRENLKEGIGKQFPSFFVFYGLKKDVRKYWDDIFTKKIKEEKPYYIAYIIPPYNRSAIGIEGIEIESKELRDILNNEYERYYQGDGVGILKRKK